MNEQVSIVLGAGNFGLTLSGFLKIQGDQVYLWGRNVNNTILHENKCVYMSGQESGVYELDVVSNDIAETFSAKSHGRNIYITVPAHAHDEIFNLIIDKLRDGDSVFLMPSRTLGRQHLSNLLIEKNLANKVNLFETNTVFLTCRKVNENKAIIYKMKHNVLISCKFRNFHKLPKWMNEYFKSASNSEISLNNMGMLLHPIPTLFNAGWIENPDFRFKYYKDGISNQIASLIEKVDVERQQVAAKLGVKTLSLKDWMIETYNSYGDNLYEVIHNNIDYLEIDAPNTLNHRYIYEDVLTGLVPTESIGKLLNIEMPYTTSIINMLCLFFDYDFREFGRKILNINELQE